MARSSLLGVDRGASVAPQPRGGDDLDEDEDPDLAFTDGLAAEADRASAPPEPGQPNPAPDAPDRPADEGGGDGDTAPEDPGDVETHRPGRG